MKKLPLFVVLSLLAFSIACGSGGNNNGGGSNPPPTGNFSKSSLNGNYAYQISGYDIAAGTALFREAGVFTADGNGNITSGTDDLSEGTNIFSDAVTGSYDISNDGTGTIELDFANGGSTTLAITLANSSKVYLAVARNGAASPATGTGMAEKQTTSALTTVPSGTFSYRAHTISTVQGSAASVGAFTITGGVVNGNVDVIRGGVQSSLTLTGSFNTPDASGRGTGTFTDSGGVTSPFTYYVVDANNTRFFFTLPGVSGLGRAELQTGGPFTNGSLSGGYAFGSQGDDNFAFDGVKTVGRLTAAGNGTITNGVLDSVEDGTSVTNVSFTGNYSVAANGRATLTTNPSGGNVQQILWLVSPSRAFFLTNDTSKVEDGTMDLQQTGTFSNATMNGQFAVVMDGFTSSALYNRLGTLKWDGAGNLSLNEFLNIGGVTSLPGVIAGSYSVASNGRTTGSINNLSNNLVFYLVSANDGYLLQNDTNVEINGIMSKQP